jgi:FixJ family two-component response regulator
VSEDAPVVYVVDDDPAVSRTLAGAARLLGTGVRAFLSAEEFLRHYDDSQPGCLVLDLRMPGMSGLELQRKLADGGGPPVVMISGHADVPIAVEVMARGAVSLLQKPFGLDELVAAIRTALERDAARRRARARADDVQARLARLTPKEREVLDLVADGRTNKQIADALFLSVRAVEDRRSRLMKKLDVRSVAELVRLRLGR